MKSADAPRSALGAPRFASSGVERCGSWYPQRNAMTMFNAPLRPPEALRQERRRHVYHRPPEPVHFPEAEEVPETNRHLEIRTALYLILKREFAQGATIGSDQFVYWDPTTSKKRLAPDAFVRLGTAHRTFRTWKTWERGAPELAVEVVSDSDEGEPDWNEKLERYRAAGIGEVVRFHPDDRKRPIRVWDAIDGDLVERTEGDPDLYACEALGLFWTVVEDPMIGPMLRLSRDREGRDLLPTPAEAEAEARKAETEARKAETEARKAEAESRKAEVAMREENQGLKAEVEMLRAELAKAKGKRR